MVGLGALMWAIAWVGVVLILTDAIEKARWFLWATFFNFPSGFIAIIAGWFLAS